MGGPDPLLHGADELIDLGGGGGAGGLIAGYSGLTSGTTFFVTVGAAGAGAATAVDGVPRDAEFLRARRDEARGEGQEGELSFHRLKWVRVPARREGITA